jgi:hypothetical protein
VGGGVLAEAVDESFDNFEFEVGGGEAVIVFLGYMYYELGAEAADGHGDEVGVGYFAFDASEQIEEGIVGEEIVEIAIGE